MSQPIIFKKLIESMRVHSFNSQKSRFSSTNQQQICLILRSPCRAEDLGTIYCFESSRAFPRAHAHGYTATRVSSSDRFLLSRRLLQPCSSRARMLCEEYVLNGLRLREDMSAVKSKHLRLSYIRRIHHYVGAVLSGTTNRAPIVSSTKMSYLIYPHRR
ncbi:hypothetical protein BDW72DRAFT_36302 [Aspergillus terricola var. indicus]